MRRVRKMTMMTMMTSDTAYGIHKTKPGRRCLFRRICSVLWNHLAKRSRLENWES